MPESNGEWIEIHNPTDRSVILDGWTVDDGGENELGDGRWRIPLGFDRDDHALLPGGSVVLAASAEGFLAEYGFEPDLALRTGATDAIPLDNVLGAMRLANAADQVNLRDADGVLVDSVGWGDQEGESDPAQHPLPGNAGDGVSIGRTRRGVQGAEPGGPETEDLPGAWTDSRDEGLEEAGPTVGGLARLPFLERVIPDSLPAGSARATLLLSGRHFDEGAQVLIAGEGVRVLEVRPGGAQSISLEVDVRLFSALGPRDITVRNPSGFLDTSPGGLEIRPHRPTLSEGPVVSELMITPPEDPAGEWIEVHNPGLAARRIDGWTVADDLGIWRIPDPTEGEDFRILAGASVVFARGGDAFLRAYGLEPDFAVDPGDTGAVPVDLLGEVRLDGAADRVVLRDSFGAAVDAVGWGPQAGDGALRHPLDESFIADGISVLRTVASDEGQEGGGEFQEALLEAWERADLGAWAHEGPDVGGLEGFPSLVRAEPPGGEPGTDLEVALLGVSTAFEQGVTVVGFGPGIEALEVAVQSPVRLTATLRLALDALPGTRDVEARTGEQVATGQRLFRVAPRVFLADADPGSLLQGEAREVLVVGVNTAFREGETDVSFGDGIVAREVRVLSALELRVPIEVDLDAEPGPRVIEARTGESTVLGPDLLRVVARPRVDSLDPAVGSHGEQLAVRLLASDTHFEADRTFAHFGPGVAVNGVEVVSPTELTLAVSVDDDAPPGPHDVAVVTGVELALGPGLFDVLPRPRLVSAAPEVALQGQALPVRVVGAFTHFEEGVSEASFGEGIAVVETRVASATELDVDVEIDTKAELGFRDLLVRTGEESAPGQALFFVGPAPVLSGLSPASALLGETLQVQIDAEHTNFAPGVTEVEFGAGVTVLDVQVSNRRRALATLEIAGDAEPGTRTVTVTTDAEVIVGAEAFHLLRPVVVRSVQPELLRRGDRSGVEIRGKGTSFRQGLTFVGLGSGLLVRAVTVASEYALIADVEVLADAPLGLRDVTVVSGDEVAFGGSLLRIGEALPIEADVGPADAGLADADAAVDAGEPPGFDSNVLDRRPDAVGPNEDVEGGRGGIPAPETSCGCGVAQSAGAGFVAPGGLALLVTAARRRRRRRRGRRGW